MTFEHTRSLDDDQAECEDCGGIIDFRESARHYKSTDDRFWCNECGEKQEFKVQSS